MGKKWITYVTITYTCVRVPLKRVIEFVGQKSARKADRVGMGGEEIEQGREDC